MLNTRVGICLDLVYLLLWFLSITHNPRVWVEERKHSFRLHSSDSWNPFFPTHSCLMFLARNEKIIIFWCLLLTKSSQWADGGRCSFKYLEAFEQLVLEHIKEIKFWQQKYCCVTLLAECQEQTTTCMYSDWQCLRPSMRMANRIPEGIFPEKLKLFPFW